MGKLITERLCMHYRQDHGIETRTVRFHNIFGEKGTWQERTEKAPAALCRKVALAKLSGNPEIEIWGDGRADTFLLLHRRLCRRHLSPDAVRFFRAAEPRPGSNGLDKSGSPIFIANAAGNDDRQKHIDGPQECGRNSDNTKLREVLGWEPAISLEDGLAATYKWIEQEVSKRSP